MGLAACAGEAPAAADRGREATFVQDDAGRAVPLAPVPSRVVSLLPSATEWVVALGAADRLVARTGWDSGPALAHLPSLGRTLAPSLEAILALAPDLVLAPPDALTDGLAARLSALGVRVYESDAQRLEVALSTGERLGALLGKPQRGARLRRSLERRIEALRQGDGPRLRALYLVWPAPPHVAGSGTYVDDLFRALGATNVFADLSGWKDVSLEAVMLEDPDVIVIPAGEGSALHRERLQGMAGWRNLRAVQGGRLAIIDEELLGRPGPRLAEAAEALAAALGRAAAGATGASPGGGTS